MGRARILFGVFLLLAGCQLPPEQAALKPLAEDTPPLAYSELVARARAQAGAANEAFYVNKWMDLEDAAKSIEQTARFFAKATDVPARHRDILPVESGDLGKDAVKLREAAKAQDVKLANEALQRIHFKIRELRADN